MVLGEFLIPAEFVTKLSNLFLSIGHDCSNKPVF